MTLPGKQEQLMDTIKKAIPSSTPVVVVLMSGSPVDISWAIVSATNRNTSDVLLTCAIPNSQGSGKELRLYKCFSLLH